eukprot:scaffold1691_cov107-Isochrysis_galbana.AAC.6
MQQWVTTSPTRTPIDVPVAPVDAHGRETAEKLHAEEREYGQNHDEQQQQVGDGGERLQQRRKVLAQRLGPAHQLENPQCAKGAERREAKVRQRHSQEAQDGHAKLDVRDDDDSHVKEVEIVHREDLGAKADELDDGLNVEDERKHRVENPQGPKIRAGLVRRPG